MTHSKPLSRPDAFRFDMWWFHDYRMNIDWNSATQILQYKMEQRKFQRRTTLEEITPSPRAWTAFKEALETCNVWDWEDIYKPELPVCDGGGCKLEISWDGKTQQTIGSNRYPHHFADFKSALSKLCGDRCIGQPFSRVLSEDVKQARKAQIIRLAIQSLGRKP